MGLSNGYYDPMMKFVPALAVLLAVSAHAAPPVKRFPAIVADIVSSDPKLQRDPKFQGCRRHAEAAYDASIGAYPPGDYRPDMAAIARLRDCLVAG